MLFTADGTVIPSAVKSSAAYPTPTPIPSVPSAVNSTEQDRLCAKALAEVEASRILIPSQKEYIAALEAYNKQLRDNLIAQNELLEEYRQLIQIMKEVKSTDSILLEKTEKQLEIVQTQLDAERRRKRSLLSRVLDILVGVGIGSVIK